MKHQIIKFLCAPCILLIRVINPFLRAWKRLYFTAMLNTDLKDVDFSVQCDGRVYVIGTGNITIGRRCRLGMAVELTTMEQGRIHLGNDIRINRGCTLTSYSEIFIDDFVIMGEFSSVRDANHGIDKRSPMRYQPHTSSPIIINRDVWIGRGCCILPGVTLGEGSVIGANSVVTRDIPAFSIAAGVPAKIIRSR